MLTPSQIVQVQAMFKWPFLKKIYLDERIAQRAVEIARDYGLKPGDSVHAASAILAGCEVIQRWDRDFDRIKDLIRSEEPQWISAQQALELVGNLGSTPEAGRKLQEEAITGEQRAPNTVRAVDGGIAAPPSPTALSPIGDGAKTVPGDSETKISNTPPPSDVGPASET